MRADDWIADFLVDRGVTDVFGIPGVVVMDFLYAIDRRKPEITPHLNYHEQGAAFAACGYAQTTGKLGVAYATRGPGFTNMLTAIADAYYDSVPTMFITAHSSETLRSEMRVMDNQEIDTVELAKSITKRAVRIDNIDSLQEEIYKAYLEATTGRKGPVFLDIYNRLFSKEVDGGFKLHIEKKQSSIRGEGERFIKRVKQQISESHRPVFLIGNGIRGENKEALIEKISLENSIPVLSSRSGQDIIPGFINYYGFVGSRATRYSNFILSKADVIISIGNRMAFPVRSKSFAPIVEKTRIIRVDIDDSEFERDIPNSECFTLDALTALDLLGKCKLQYADPDGWMKTCNVLKMRLKEWDKNTVISVLVDLLDKSYPESTLVCDVGNHSFWVTTAYAYSKTTNRILYSGSFGSLGCALPKAIGAYYATRKPVICFAGDQGIQMNIQELQFISLYRLPISIVILNNMSSGMIMEREAAKYGDYLVHTTVESGYGYPDFGKIADCYNFEYKRIDCEKENDHVGIENDTGPRMVEINIGKNTTLEPSLPIGRVCQDLAPYLPRELYEELDRL